MMCLQMVSPPSWLVFGDKPKDESLFESFAAFEAAMLAATLNFTLCP